MNKENSGKKNREASSLGVCPGDSDCKMLTRKRRKMEKSNSEVITEKDKVVAVIKEPTPTKELLEEKVEPGNKKKTTDELAKESKKKTKGRKEKKMASDKKQSTKDKGIKDKAIKNKLSGETLAENSNDVKKASDFDSDKGKEKGGILKSLETTMKLNSSTKAKQDLSSMPMPPSLSLNNSFQYKNPIIKSAIDNLKSEDEGLICSCLIELSSDLSIAHENVASDPLCSTLLKDILETIDKFYNQDIKLYSIYCINYLLDINANLVSTILRNDGIQVLVNQTQNIEFIDVAESSIKVIEKISTYSPITLLENGGFLAVITNIDFFDLNLRKVAVKACLNMANSCYRTDMIKQKILPAMPILISLMRYSGSSDIEKFILDTCISSIKAIFTNFINIKEVTPARFNNFGNLNIRIEELEKRHSFNHSVISANNKEELLPYITKDFFENLLEVTSVILSYINEDGSFNKNFNNFIDTLKNILRLLEFTSKHFPETVDLLLKRNILEIIYSFLKYEIGHCDNDGSNEVKNQKIAPSSQTLISDLLSLLTSFFPEKFEDPRNKQKILSQENLQAFLFFSEKIINLLLSNIINISSSKTFIRVVKLLGTFISLNPKETIEKYINKSQLANLISKMLDSKDTSYILEIYIIIEDLMAKSPDFYLISFIREGVADNIKKLIKVTESELYLSPITYSAQDYLDLKLEMLERKGLLVIEKEEDKKEAIDIMEENCVEEVEDIKGGNKEGEKREKKAGIEEERELLEDFDVGNKQENSEKEEKKVTKEFQQNHLLGDSSNLKQENDLFMELDEVIEEKKQKKTQTERLNLIEEDDGDYENENNGEEGDEYNDIEEDEEESISYNGAMDIDSNINKISSPQKASKIENESEKYNNLSNPRNFSQKKDNGIVNKPITFSPSKDKVFDFKSSVKDSLFEYRYKRFEGLMNMRSLDSDNTASGTGNKDIFQRESKLISKIEKDCIKNSKNVSEIDSFITKMKLSGELSANIIKMRSEEVYAKYFRYLESEVLANTSTSPKYFLNLLVHFSESLRKNSNREEVSYIDSDLVKGVLEILINKENAITFYEIEKSEIINTLAGYIDKVFTENEEQFDSAYIFNNSNKVNEASNKVDMFTVTNQFLSCFNKSKECIESFVNLLQSCIRSMNCFKLYLFESTKRDTRYSSATRIGRKTTLTLEYNLNEDIVNEYNLNQNFYTIHNYYMGRKFISILVDQTETFLDIEKRILKMKCEDDNYIPALDTKDYLFELENELINTRKDSEDIVSTGKVLQHFLERKQSNLSEDGGKSRMSLPSLSSRRESQMINPKNLNQLDVIEENEEQEDEAEKFPKSEQMDIEKSNLQETVNVDNERFPDFQISLDENINKALDEDSNTKIIKKINESNDKLLKNLRVSFYVVIGQRRYQIDKTWCMNTLLKELKEIEYLKTDSGLSKATPIKFEFEESSSKERVGNRDNENIFGCKLESNTIDENLFNHYYRVNIVNNPSIYVIKRATPYFYLLALLELSIRNYSHIFTLDTIDFQSVNIADSSNSIFSSFHNGKVTSLLLKQIRDPTAILSNSIPKWCKEISQNMTFLTNFNTRYLFFKTCSFDQKRAMTNLYIYVKNFIGENLMEDNTSTSSRRRKFTINREKVIESSKRLKEDMKAYKGYIEFEYPNEIGTGNGPTLEFYTLFSKEICENTHLWHKTSDNYLFPKPLSKLKQQGTLSESKKMFNLLGYIIARGLYDDRLLDIPLSSAFWDLVLNRPISIKTLGKIDKDIGLAFINFQSCLKTHNNNLKITGVNDHSKDLNDIILYNGERIDFMGLSFSIPGYPDIPLTDHGLETVVDAYNLQKYIDLVFDAFFGNGMVEIVEEFKKGFDEVFPISNLKCFTSEEIESILIENSCQDWTIDLLSDEIVPNHGYNKNSFIFNGLVSILTQFSLSDKKKFLQFVTGTSRLPIGGIKNLSPKMTVVKKTMDTGMISDNSLPTVMTCQNYLKLPEYSSVEILKEKLLLAISEGKDAFLLS